MAELVTRVSAYIRRHELLTEGSAVLVGVSGGADSLCLLHLLHHFSPQLGLRLHVAHLNHMLRGDESDADAAFVESLATSWGLPCTLGRVAVRAVAAEHHLSLEEAARQARYEFLARTARLAGATHIAVAHHADDQAETVLMHLLRGSGVAGLRGMLPRMPLSDYRVLSERAGGVDADLVLVRPLLGVRRVEVEAYCLEHGLPPRIDRSNADTTIHRNRLRHELLPILRRINPAIDEVLVHTADVMVGDYEVLAQATKEALSEVLLDAPRGAASSPVEIHMQLDKWRDLSIGLQRAVVRAAVGRLRRTLRNINWEHIEAAVRIGREGATGDSATITAGLALTVGYETLRIGPEGASLPGAVPQVCDTVALQAPGVTVLDNGWRVRVQLLSVDDVLPDFAQNPDPWTAWLDADVVGPDLTLRPRRGGDRFQPLGLGGHSARVNEFMINAKIPAADRAGWPLLVASGNIAWLCGLRIDGRAALGPLTRRVWQVRFEQ